MRAASAEFVLRPGLLRARDGDIRSHIGAHLSVPKKSSKVCADRGVQFELRSCGQCSEGWGERTCFEGSGGLSDPALENQWQGCSPNTNLVKTCSLDRILEGSNIRPLNGARSRSAKSPGTVSRSATWRAAYKALSSIRDHVAIASCPPGLSARRISLRAANRSGKNCRPCHRSVCF